VRYKTNCVTFRLWPSCHWTEGASTASLSST